MVSVQFETAGDFGHASSEFVLGVGRLVREEENELGVISVGKIVDVVGADDAGKWDHVCVEEGRTEG